MTEEPRAADGKRVGKRAENGGANRGFAGAVDEARNEAPEDATGRELERAAIAIWVRGLDAAEAWDEVERGDDA